MWLLHVDTLELEEFIGNAIPPYAILSHTWGPEEVSFTEMKKPKYRKDARQNKGFPKIEGCCARAKKSGYTWVWVDSCCIDKRSSAELSEALNSMFEWYKSSDVCYVYLSDVSNSQDLPQIIRKSRWFTRGWTLQELLAPRTTYFFAQDWTLIGYMGSLFDISDYPTYDDLNSHDTSSQLPLVDLTWFISEITGIPIEFLSKNKRLDQACVSQRMFWASHRTTTRPEDRAYSLMGLFDINMPIIYGEGLEKAFARLQQEICNTTPDQSIFAWYRSDVKSYRLLADSPDCFQNSGNVIRLVPDFTLGSASANIRSAFYMTNLGLRVTIPVCMENTENNDRLRGKIYAKIHCFVKTKDKNRQHLTLSLTYLDTDIGGRAIYVCERPSRWIFNDEEGHPTSIFIRGVNHDVDDTEEVRPTSTLGPAYVSTIAADIIGDATCYRSFEYFDYKHLEGTVTFSEMGVDSLLLLDIMHKIKVKLGLKVYAQDFYDHPTMGEFREFMCSVARSPSRQLLREDNDQL